jgi:YggT family protein
MYALVEIIRLAVTIYTYIIIIQVAISWLIAFGIINADNEKAQNLITLLKKATDPVYKPVQKYIPPIGGIDLTPLIVIIGLSLISNIIIDLLI